MKTKLLSIVASLITAPGSVVREASPALVSKEKLKDCSNCPRGNKCPNITPRKNETGECPQP